MALIQVFSYPLLTRHYSRVCSKSSIFCFILILLELYIPYYLTSRTQGFWKVIDSYREQPDVKFKHKMLIIMETRFPDELIFWSTYEKLNLIMDKSFQHHMPAIEHREEDINMDGKHDELQMNIDVPVSSKEILSLKVILLFDYKLYDYVNLQMESVAYIHYTSTLPGASFSLFGDLCINQKEALKYSESNIYDVPFIDSDSLQSSSILAEILMNYSKRNVSTSLRNTYPLWESGPAVNDSFKINLVITYPEDTILYRTGLRQRLLWAVVQYIAIFIIIRRIYKLILWVLFRNQILSSIVIYPVQTPCMKKTS